MPCNSDYMSANNLEIELSKMLMLIEELKTGVPVDSTHSWWSGYHPKAYCKGPNRKACDAAAKFLCTNLKTKDVTKYSLEMQTWWRDHQHADAERERREKKYWIVKEQK